MIQRKPSRRAAVGIFLLAVLAPAPRDLLATELGCERDDNLEAGCCCFKKAHTYEFDARQVSRLDVTFDTGRGIGCRSQVDVQVLRRGNWQTLRTISAISSEGRSQTHRQRASFELGGTIAGVRIGDGGRCYIDHSMIVLDGAAAAEPGIATTPWEAPPPAPAARIVADPAPPYRELPVTVDFSLEPGPVDGAVWWLDDRRMTNAEIFFWTFGVAGRHRIELRDARGEHLAGLNLDLLRPAEPRFEIVPDRQPPYRVPARLIFRQEPRPVDRARWYVDGAYASSARTLTREFLEPRRYRVELRSSRGEVLASYDLVVTDPGHQR